MTERYYYFQKKKDDSVVNFILQANKENHILKFKYEFMSYAVEDDLTYVASIRDDQYILNIKSHDDAIATKFNRDGSVEQIEISTDDPVINDIIFNEYCICPLGWRPIFNVDYINGLFGDDCLFFFNSVLGFGATVMKYIRCDTDELFFEDPSGNKSSITITDISKIIHSKFEDQVNRTRNAYDFKTRQREMIDVNRRASFVLLNIIIPVRMIPKETIMEVRNDLIPYDYIDKKQVYRYDGSLYKIGEITTSGVYLIDIFGKSSYSDSVVIEHTAMKDLPVFSSETRAKRADVSAVTVFKGNMSVVLRTKEDLFEDASYPFSRHSDVYYHTNNNTFPQDVKTVYGIVGGVGIDDSFDCNAFACSVLNHPNLGIPKDED